MVTSPLKRFACAPSSTVVVNSIELSTSVRSPSGKFIAIPLTFAMNCPRSSGAYWT